MANARSFNVRTIFLIWSAVASYTSVAYGGLPGGRRVLPASGPVVFDVAKFGAKGDGSSDNFMAFLKAWIGVCSSAVPAKLVVPKGTFLAGPTVFAGPCSSGPITVEVQGTVKAAQGILDSLSDEWILFEHISDLIVTGSGTFDGAGHDAWKDGPGGDLPPASLKFRRVNNTVVHGITSINSKGFHMFVVTSNNFTAYNLTITAPDESPNTDGIHLSKSNLVNISNSHIGTGDDCVSIGHGSTNVSISRVVCGPGHGISIGSLGKYKNELDVSGVVVNNCTLRNTTNGLRIKTWPASPPSQARSITFENIILENVKNPIIIDQNYRSRKKEPSRVKISDVHFRNIVGTTVTKKAVSLACSSAVPCQGIEIADVDLAYSGAASGESSDANNSSSLSALCLNANVLFTGKRGLLACL